MDGDFDVIVPRAIDDAPISPRGPKLTSLDVCYLVAIESKAEVTRTSAAITAILLLSEPRRRRFFILLMPVNPDVVTGVTPVTVSS